MTSNFDKLVAEDGIDQALEAWGVTNAFRRLRQEQPHFQGSLVRAFNRFMEHNMVAKKDPRGVVARAFRRIRADRAYRATLADKKYTFVLHPQPRAHDLFGIYMFKEAADGHHKLYIGDYEIVADRTRAPFGKTAEELLALGIIPLCVGDGPWSKADKQTEKTMTKNIEEWLASDYEMWLDGESLQNMVEWVNTTHTKFPGNNDKTLGLIRILSLAQMDEPQAVYDQFEAIIDACRAFKVWGDTQDLVPALACCFPEEPGVVRDLLGLLDTAIEAVRLEEELAAGDLEKIRIEDLKVKGRRKPLRVGVIRSDSNVIARRSLHDQGTDVLILRRTSGHVLVLANKGICLNRVASNLREEESGVAGIPINGSLTEPGFAYEGDPWYFEIGNMCTLSNGGITAPELPPTKLDLETIELAVLEGLLEK